MCTERCVISVVLRFSVKWQPCLKMEKWNQHTSLFYMLIVKQSTPVAGTINSWLFQCTLLVREVAFCVIKRWAAPQFTFALTSLKMPAQWRLYLVIIITATKFKCQSVADILGRLSWMNTTDLQWWVSLYLNRFAFTTQMTR